MTYEDFAAARLQPLLRYAVMLTGDPHLAEDLVQETMVRVQLKWSQVERTDVPELYVRRMLTNAYLDLRRGAWLRRVLVRADPEPRATVPDPADSVAERDRVWHLLAGLPSRARAVLVLRYYEDLSDAQIAEVLDCAVGTVRSLVSRALATLRATLDPALTPSTACGDLP